MKKINNYTLTQQGFTQLLLVALLAIGIITGTVLVQTGVNFLPRAQEQEGLNPSAGRTKNCDSEENKDQCISENNAICARDTVTYCDNREGSPRAIRKSGGYYEPSHGNADPASGCVFDYREVSGKNSECGKSESKSGDVVYTTVEEARRLDSERESTRSSREQSQGSSTVSDAACTDTTTEKAMKDEKVTGNLVRLYSILAGMPEYCTPADLGAGPHIIEEDAEGKTGRLMLCSGKDGSRTWRIIQGNRLVPAKRGTPNEPADVEAFLSSYINKALEVAK